MKINQLIAYVVGLLLVVTTPALAQTKMVESGFISANDGTKTYLIVKSLTIASTGSSVVFTANSTTSYSFRCIGTTPNASSDKNFVRTEKILADNITSESSIAGLSVSGKATTYEYIDGMARTLQTVKMQASPAMKDVVVPFAFDNQGRQAREYLPYVSGQTNGGFRTGATSEVATYYGDSRPFKESKFEESSLNRVTDTYGAGAAWNNGTVDKATRSFAKLNTETMRQWNPYTGGNPTIVAGGYTADKLLVQETTDEGGQITKVYADFRGLTVAKRVGDGTNWNETQYIYDLSGRLVIVIQPEGVFRLATEFDAGGADKTSFLNRWCFQYQYDEEGRMIAKRLPGWSPTYWHSMVYDRWNREVLSQTPRQKEINQWKYTKYDAFNRVILVGLYTSSSDRSTMQSAVNTYYNANPGKRFETQTGSTYSQNICYPTGQTDPTLITVNYYDSYSYIPSGFSYTNISGFPVYATEVLAGAKGYVTATKNRINTTTWRSTVNYYDRNYRIVQTKTDNVVGGIDRITSKYDFVGRVIKAEIDHTGSTPLTAVRDYTYDQSGRLLTLSQTVAGTTVLLASNKYDENGNLIEKNIHSTDGGVSFLQSVDMRYNIRGWITSINNSLLSNDGSLNNDANDIFGEELVYNQDANLVVANYPGTGKIPQLYNGNIGAIKWKADTKQPNVTPKQQIYGFEYDPWNRLKKAYYATNSSGTWTGNAGLFDEAVTLYDKNGNIKNLTRNSQINGASAPIDNTTHSYTYSGSMANFAGESNRLVAVSEGIGGTAAGFKDGATATEEYKYDASGNLIYDLNKSISSVSYNYLNQPQVIEFTRTDGSTTTYDQIVYTYDASGAKLKMDVYKGGASSGTNGTRVWTTEYAGEVQYDTPKDDSRRLTHALTPEGRLVNKDSGYDYEYFYKDHLDNVRMTYGLMKETASYRATMEDPAAPSTLGDNEEATFKNILSTRYQNAGAEKFNYTKPSDQTLNPDRSSRTYSATPIGPAISLHLASGDRVKMEVFAKYTQTPGSTSTIGDAALAAAVVTSTFGIPSTGETATLYNNLNTQVPIIAGSGSPSSTLPQAYLAYLFFSDSYVFVASGAVAITTSAYDAFQKLEKTYTAPQSGYLYVYVANEALTSVHWDEMLVVHQKNTSALQVTQANDYYPFGLSFNKYQSDRINDNATIKSLPRNLYQFQAQESQNDLDLGWSQFKARMHDPALGRFVAIDPLADEYEHNSTYAFSENRLVDGIELEGKEWTRSVVPNDLSFGKLGATTETYNVHFQVVNNTTVPQNDIEEQLQFTQKYLDRVYLTPVPLTKTLDPTNPVMGNYLRITMTYEFITKETADPNNDFLLVFSHGIKDLDGTSIEGYSGNELGFTNVFGGMRSNLVIVNVDGFKNGKDGNSLPYTIAHEIGHTADLRHLIDPLKEAKNPTDFNKMSLEWMMNIMHPTGTRNALLDTGNNDGATTMWSQWQTIRDTYSRFAKD